MLGLPDETEISTLLPKKRMFEEFELSVKQRLQLNRDVSRMNFTNVISPDTIPSLKKTEGISAIYIVKVDLRDGALDMKAFEKIARSMPQHMLYIIEHEGWSQLAIFYEQFFVSSPVSNDSLPKLQLEGLDMGSVWENLVLEIGNFKLEKGRSLSEQIRFNIWRNSIKAQIEDLQNKAYKAKQPHVKMELIQKINFLKKELG